MRIYADHIITFIQHSKLSWLRFVTTGVLILGLAATPPAQTALAAGPFTVNAHNDTHCTGFVSQNAPGCTAVTDGSGKISIRSALEYASTQGGSTDIFLPVGTYNLSLGDLVVGIQANTTITIHGQGTALNTTVNQTQTGRMVFLVNYNVNANVVFNLDHVAVTGGNEQDTDPDGFGGNGGAMLAGGSSTASGNSVSLDNVIFTGNSTNPLVVAGATGGAINMTGGGDLTITNSIFSNNQAGVGKNGSGGAVYFDNGGQPGNVSIANTTFSNNQTTGTSGGGEGGAVFLAGGSGTTFTLNNNTFTGNKATLRGGAIYLSTGSLTGNFDRITGNTAVTDNSSGIYVANNAGSTADMRNTWWGCNAGPGGSGCDQSFPAINSPTPLSAGQIAFNPWIVLKATTSPNPINVGTSTTMTASFLQNSAGGPLTAGQISQLIGLTVTWANAVHGSFSNPQTLIQSNGMATSTFNSDNTCNNGSGEAKVDQVLDGDEVTTVNITVLCSDLTAVKSNNVSGKAIFPTGWTWTIHVANGGAGYADFPDGMIILSDNLPNSGLTYGSPGVSNATGLSGMANCSIDGSDNLSCAASGDVHLNTGGSFDVTFTVTPTQGRMYTNPRSAGSCSVDPSNVVVESNETNNSCSDSVTVLVPWQVLLPIVSNTAMP